MSFIVKGFDIPKNAMFFKLSFYDEDGDTEYGVKGSLKPYIIQIPKGHGRLIDIEKLKEGFAMKNNICKECDSFKECGNKTYSKSEICENFIWAPTILEAEK